MRLVGLFDLATGVWIGAASGPFRGSERNLCRKPWQHVRAGDTFVADSGFRRWFTLYLFDRKGVNVVMRNNGVRKTDPKAARLGAGDRLERWSKPDIRPKWISPQAYASMPDSIAVRVVAVNTDPMAGFGTTGLQIACTVLDPEKMSALNIGALYQKRWKVELFIDDLKTTLGMAVLQLNHGAEAFGNGPRRNGRRRPSFRQTFPAGTQSSQTKAEATSAAQCASTSDDRNQPSLTLQENHG